MIYVIIETVGLCTVSLPVLRYVSCVVGVWGKATNWPVQQDVMWYYHSRQSCH